MEVGVAHVAAVDEEVLQRVALAGVLRQAHEPGDFHQRRGGLDGYELPVERLAEQSGDALFERAGKQLVECHVVMRQQELQRGVHQGEPLELVYYVRELHRVAFEEFASGRNVEEEVLHHYVGARGARFGALSLELRSRDFEIGADAVAPPHGAQLNLGHGGH